MTKKCFVVCPIGKVGSEVRKRSDKVLKFIIEPVLMELGYETVRADKIDNPGMITTQVINAVIESDLVVADLSGSNPNVFYELALRHMTKKPTIHLNQFDEPIPFDVADFRTIAISVSDLELAENAKAEMKRQITALETGEREVDNPISIAADLNALRSSGKPEEKSLARLSQSIKFLIDEVVDLREIIDMAISDGHRLEPDGSFIASRWFHQANPAWDKWSSSALAEHRSLLLDLYRIDKEINSVARGLNGDSPRGTKRLEELKSRKEQLLDALENYREASGK